MPKLSANRQAIGVGFGKNQRAHRTPSADLSVADASGSLKTGQRKIRR
ncbi:MAG: hypothetical protein NT142_10890 [Planctomycetota bacterium]|nr:hypothetical protein [Planctomycetota bacterium]